MVDENASSGVIKKEENASSGVIKKEENASSGVIKKEENASSGASGSSDNKDIEFDSWVESMETMLGCLQNPIVQACSISFVPEQLGKSKVEAYTPRKVSIGPLHRGASPDLIFMEDIKWRRMKDLVFRTQQREKNLKCCSKAILDLDDIFRASYNVDDIKFNNYDLSKILLVDGCFLLELLIRESHGLNTDIPERELVLSDLTVLGNQIPFIILSKLATLLFPNVYPLENGIIQREAEKRITKSVLSLLGYPSDFPENYSFCPVHVLGLVHSFITWESEKQHENQKSQDSSSNVDHKEKIDKSKGEEMKLKGCATRLEAAGIVIKPPECRSEHEEIRFDLKIIFSNGNLEIPPLHITETTETKWRNFIAWELTRSPYSKSVGCKFFWYALFFQGLICSVHDVQLLIDREVIVVHDAESSSLDRNEKKKKKMSNEDLLAFFRNITKGIRADQIVNDSQFNKLFQRLNSYPRHSCWVTVISRILWHFCRRVLTAIWYFFRNSYTILIRDHITTRWKLIVAVSATLTLAFTFIGTFFTGSDH